MQGWVGAKVARGHLPANNIQTPETDLLTLLLANLKTNIMIVRPTVPSSVRQIRRPSLIEDWLESQNLTED